MKSKLSALGIGMVSMLAGACAYIPPATQDAGLRVLEGSADKNPDVIWVTRQIRVIEKATGLPVDRVGLYACYRADKPGEPTCYLAKTYIAPEELSWPDNPDDFYIWEGNPVTPSK